MTTLRNQAGGRSSRAESDLYRLVEGRLRDQARALLAGERDPEVADPAGPDPAAGLLAREAVACRSRPPPQMRTPRPRG